jgi:UDP-N-acetylglucosamine:LPS N-acetylglucosamine transferase
MTDQRRVLILTSDAGLGHRNAAEAIAAALDRTYGDNCTVEIVNPLADERVPGLLRSSQDDYDLFVQEMPELYEFGYQASDAAVPTSVIEGVLIVALFLVIRDLVRRHDPDVVVTTIPIYQAPVGAVFATGERRVPLITVVTDLVTIHRLWFSQAADLCIVPTEIARDLATSYGLAPERVIVAGIPVDPAIAEGEREADEIRGELDWRLDLPALLAVGGKRVENMLPVLQALNHAGMPLQLAAVAGGDDALYRQFQEVEWHAVTHVYNFVDNMPVLMRASDLVLCKAGGLIVSEALACGLPLVLIDVIPGQEVGNAEYVVEHGAGELAEDPLAALEIIYHWLENDRELLAERRRDARRVGRPRAAFEIAEYAWRLGGETDWERADETARRSALFELLDRHGVPWKEA